VPLEGLAGSNAVGSGGVPMPLGHHIDPSGRA